MQRNSLKEYKNALAQALHSRNKNPRFQKRKQFIRFFHQSPFLILLFNK